MATYSSVYIIWWFQKLFCSKSDNFASFFTKIAVYESHWIFFASPCGWPEFLATEEMPLLPNYHLLLPLWSPPDTRNQTLSSSTIDDHNKEGRWGNQSIIGHVIWMGTHIPTFLFTSEKEKSIFLLVACWIISGNASYLIDMWTRFFLQIRKIEKEVWSLNLCWTGIRSCTKPPWVIGVDLLQVRKHSSQKI